jgi:hypothetical protein
MFGGSGNDNDFITKLRRMLSTDPSQAQALSRLLNDPAALQKLKDQQSGPATIGNTLGAGMQAAQKAGANNPIGELVGLGGGALANLLKRRGKNAGRTQDTSGADRGPAMDQTTSGAEPNLSGTPGASSSSDGVTEVAPAEAWKHGAAGSPLAATADSAPAPTGSSLMMGQDKEGNNIHSLDGGQTWVTEKGAAVTGPAYQATNIGTVGGGGATSPPASSGADDSLLGDGIGGDSFMDEMARGGPILPPKKSILLRRPGGGQKKAAVPVISTTIVIAPKKKQHQPEKKAKGGTVKPAAVEVPPAPYAKGGRVQVPRGTGIAQRGKRFRGIF